MKPKKKSNVIMMALLFLLSGFTATASWPVPDTIIIDGETIYIEKTVVRVDLDSLNEAARNDVQSKPVAKRPWTLGINGGMNITSGTYRTSLGDFKALTDFVGQEKSVLVNPIVGLEAGARIWRFPAGKGLCDLHVSSGFSYNGINVKCTYLMDEAQFQQDSLLKLRYTDDELLLDYFNYFEPPSPFGELDTIAIDLENDIISYKTFDVPLMLRLSYSQPKSRMIVFGEVGVTRRFIQAGGHTYDNYLVNELGEYVKFTKSEFRTNELIRPTFAFGAERKLDGKGESDEKYLTFGFRFAGQLPKTALNSGSLFVIDIRTFSSTIILRAYF